MNNKEAGIKIVAGGLSLLLLSGCENNVVQANENIPPAIISESIPETIEEKETTPEITIPETEVIFESKPIIIVDETTETTPMGTTVAPTETTVAPTETTTAPTETTVTPTETTATPEKRAKPSVIIYRGDSTKAEIAFTFDDAGAGLGKILNILNEKGIKGTFFLLAGELKANPERWQKAVEDGHQICNHTVGHRYDLPKLSEEAIKKEILGWEKVAKKVLGYDYFERMKKEFPYFRSPGGNSSKRLQQVLGDLGYSITAYWSCEDCWSMRPENNPSNLTLVQCYTRNTKNGAIFLLHGGNAKYVAEIIDNVEAKSYQFKLLSEILD